MASGTPLGDGRWGVLRFANAPRSSPTSWRENLRQVLPLLFVAAAAFVLSYYLFEQAGNLHPTRIPLWLLSSSIGVVATVGATTAIVFGDFADPAESPTHRAWESGDYVLVPTRTWEFVRPRDAPAPGEKPAGRERPSAVRPVPAHARPVPNPALTPTPSADRLAAQVDQLLRELSLDEPQTAHPEPTHPSPDAWAEWSEDPSELGVPVVDALNARAEYESLLRTLSEQAQRGESSAPSTRCSGCARISGVTDAWEACPRCQRTFCPQCAARYHPDGSEFRCPRCGAASHSR